MKNELTTVFLPELDAKTIVTVRLLKQLNNLPVGTPIFCGAEELIALENNEVKKIYGYTLINPSYNNRIAIHKRSYLTSVADPAFIENIDILLGKNITVTQLKTIGEKAKINFPLCLIFDITTFNDLRIFVTDILSQLYNDYKHIFTLYANIPNEVLYGNNKKYAFLLSILDVRNFIIDYDTKKIDGLIISLDFVQLDKNDEICQSTKLTMHILSNYKENITEIDGEQFETYTTTQSVEHLNYAKYLLKNFTNKKKELTKKVELIWKDSEYHQLASADNKEILPPIANTIEHDIKIVPEYAKKIKLYNARKCMVDIDTSIFSDQIATTAPNLDFIKIKTAYHKLLNQYSEY